MNATAEELGLAPGYVTKGALDGLYHTGHWLYSRSRYRDAANVFRVMALSAPEEERSFLALGACHEGLGQHRIALEIYAAAGMITSAPRCHVGRARLLRREGLDDDAEEALDQASAIADEWDDDDLRALIASERRLS